MSHLIFILLVETLLVLMIPLIILIALNGKKKKKNTADIERLLVQVKENDTKRKKHLVKYLTSQLSMEEQPSLELVEDFIAAEKRFTQQFLGIHLNQQPISDFYQHSCEFVDKYLQLVADNVPKALNDSLDVTSGTPAEEPEKVENSEQLEEKSKEQEIESEMIDSDAEKVTSDKADQATSSEAEPIAEPNNTKEEENNSLDITNDAPPEKPENVEQSEQAEDKSKEQEIEPETMDSDAEKSASNETEATADTNIIKEQEGELAEEPDWGDAFAETGEVMDESLLEQDPPLNDSGK